LVLEKLISNKNKIISAKDFERKTGAVHLGAATFSAMTLSITTASITIKNADSTF
jgi:hypothetical protein